jgi:two-component system, sporulation sensor kinase E
VKPNSGEIIINANSHNGKFSVSIKDNGCGISRENLNRIFDPYFTSKPNGMGLGLSATHNIIHTHEGHIDIESELNKGTRFLIQLNMAQNVAGSAG